MIRVEGIKKIFNPHSRNANEVLKGVSFELPEKGLIAIFGKSGSGKTTLLNIIGGLDKQDSGKVYIDNEDTSGKEDYIRNAKIGYIFQNYYLENGYTIAEIMKNAMLIAGFKDENEITRRTEEVLKLVKMDRYKNKKSDALSGGQKQRIAIARALIKGSDIILADEPTGNLDAENTIIIMDILKEISKTQLVVLVTHEVTLIHNYADSHIKLVDGELKNNEELEKDIKYEVDRNNIYVDSNDKKTYSVGETNINLYGKGVKTEDIEIFTDKGTLYLKAGKGVTILDNTSEKKVIFNKNEEHEEIKIDSIPKFEKSIAKKNGRLFTLKSIIKNLFSDKDKASRTGNVFKNIFIVAFALIMCFFSMMTFEAVNTNIENKIIDNNNVYVNLNTYDDLKIMPKELYNRVDFFDTQMKEGIFTFGKMTMLSGIRADYVPKAIEQGTSKEELKLTSGKMPEIKQVVITKALANRLKREFRLKELETDEAMLLVKFNGEYAVSGIIEGDVPAVYMNKQDYVNFLGVYNEIMFVDSENIFFSEDYAGVSFTSEVVVASEDRKLSPNESHIEINRNSLYKMMPDVIDADYKVKTANSRLIAHEGRTGFEIKNSYLYVKKLEITRDVMTTDIRIYVSQETMNNIFVYIKPNIDALKGSTSSMGIESKFYFEISTDSGEQLTNLNNWLVNDKRIPLANIEKQYESENKEVREKATQTLNIFAVVMVLMFLIYYFIEKSGSLKNSKEYGIYRAIGVNKGNLLYKEVVRTLVKNISIYFISYLVVLVVLVIRYYMMNIVYGQFIGIAVGVFMLSSVVMLLISLIPYLFVLVKTPSAILARYDI